MCSYSQVRADKSWHEFGMCIVNVLNDLAYIFLGTENGLTIFLMLSLGIYWDKLSPEKLGQIKILRELKSRIERETGQKLPTGPSEKLPPTAQRRRR